MAGTLITALDQDTRPSPATLKMKAKCYDTMQKAESKEQINYLKEMGTIKKELNLDELYCKKFGLLKKASVLAYYRRMKDAKLEISKAAAIVQ